MCDGESPAPARGSPSNLESGIGLVASGRCQFEILLQHTRHRAESETSSDNKYCARLLVMNGKRITLTIIASLLIGGPALVWAQQPAGGSRGGPPPGLGPQGPMSFFVTSVGIGKGANLGGLAGADAHCQKLAAAAGA